MLQALGAVVAARIAPVELPLSAGIFWAHSEYSAVATTLESLVIFLLAALLVTWFENAHSTRGGVAAR